jgi:hypothetical protein
MHLPASELRTLRDWGLAAKRGGSTGPYFLTTTRENATKDVGVDSYCVARDNSWSHLLIAIPRCMQFRAHYIFMFDRTNFPLWRFSCS